MPELIIETVERKCWIKRTSGEQEPYAYAYKHIFKIGKKSVRICISVGMKERNESWATLEMWSSKMGWLYLENLDSEEVETVFNREKDDPRHIPNHKYFKKDEDALMHILLRHLNLQ